MTENESKFLINLVLKTSSRIDESILLEDILNRVRIIDSNLHLEKEQIRIHYLDRISQFSDNGLTESIQVLLIGDLATASLLSAVIESITKIGLVQVHFELTSIEDIGELKEKVFSRAKEINDKFKEPTAKTQHLPAHHTEAMTHLTRGSDSQSKNRVSVLKRARAKFMIRRQKIIPDTILAEFREHPREKTSTHTISTQTRKLLDITNYKFAFLVSLMLLIAIPVLALQGQKRFDDITTSLFLLLSLGTAWGFISLKFRNRRVD